MMSPIRPTNPKLSGLGYMRLVWSVEALQEAYYQQCPRDQMEMETGTDREFRNAMDVQKSKKQVIIYCTLEQLLLFNCFVPNFYLLVCSTTFVFTYCNWDYCSFLINLKFFACFRNMFWMSSLRFSLIISLDSLCTKI